MGAAQAIPIVGEVVTIAEGGGKAIAAGVCAAVGDHKSAEQLIHGAGQTFKDYSEVNAIAANIHLAVASAKKNHEKVELIKERQSKAWLDVVESTPLLGHGIGVARYAAGDSEGGDRCMIGATRSTILMAATVATGGAGALTCGAAVAGSGMGFDGITTVCNSAAKHQYAPVGVVAGIEQAVKTGDANDVFDVVAMPLADAVAGALHGHLKANAIDVHVEKLKPAADLIAEWESSVATARRLSIPERYKACTEILQTECTEIEGSSKQISLAELKGNGRTAGFVKEFSNPAEAMQQVERGQKYDFVRMQDGRMRVIKHSDAGKVVQMLGDRSRSVGNTSLVEPGTSVVAAGEMNIGPTGIIESINCQIGDFQVPLSTMTNQMGRVLPRSIVTFDEYPTFRALLAKVAATHIAIYSPTLITVLTDTKSSSTPLSSSAFIISFHEGTSVKIIAMPGIDETCAKEAYDTVPLTCVKVLIRKPGDIVLAKHGGNRYVDICKEEVRFINSVFPSGSWRHTSKEAESWFDSMTESFQMRCSSRARDGSWKPNTLQFQPQDWLENQNGTLVKLF